MSKHDQNLLAEIERDALDEQKSLSATLRKCIALGSKVQNADLRDWASQELAGYRDDATIPPYRIIHAPLKINMVAGFHRVTGLQISWIDIPEFARDHITEELKVAYGVGDLQAMLKNAQRDGKSAVKLMPFGAADVVKIMNHESQDDTRAVTELYWDVSLSPIEGVLDHIRTTLVRLVSEMRATMGHDTTLPSSEQAAQAINVVLKGGKRHQVNVTAAHADNGAMAIVTPALDQQESSWAKTSTIWTVLGVIVAVVALYVAYRQWRG